MDVEAVAVLGITRAYTTRHGEGPLPTFSAELTARLQDPGNPWNRWQGNLRCGWLDLPLLRYAAAVAGPLDGMVVNHLDQVAGSRVPGLRRYQDGDLTPSAAPDLAWQGRLTEQLRTGRARPRRRRPRRGRRRLGEIAPVVLKGSGRRTSNEPTPALRYRTRRPASVTR